MYMPSRVKHKKWDETGDGMDLCLVVARETK